MKDFFLLILFVILLVFCFTWCFSLQKNFDNLLEENQSVKTELNNERYQLELMKHDIYILKRGDSTK